MTDLLTSIVLFLLNTFYQPTTGVSTIFGQPGDKWAGGTLACAPDKKVDRSRVCAHRSLPCGTLLVLKNPRNGQMSYCAVFDRGPYGAMHEGKWLVKRKASDPGVWRGTLDIGPASAEPLQHNGFQKVKFWRIN